MNRPAWVAILLVFATSLAVATAEAQFTFEKPAPMKPPVQLDQLIQSYQSAAPSLPNAPTLSNEAGTCTVLAIACNTTQSGTFSSSDCTLDSDNTFVELWTFPGVSGQRVTITMRSSTVDSYLGLANPNGTVVEQDDDSGGGSDARIVYTLTSTGTWIIVANEYDRETGSYTLQLECGATCTPQVRTTSCNQTTSGTIDSTDCTVSSQRVEFWRFTGQAGQQVSVSASRTSGTGAIGLAVLHEDGTLLGTAGADDGDASVSGALPKQGTWVVSVLSPGSASYSLTLSCQDSSACTPGANTLCLNGSRFKVTLSAKDPRTGNVGSGQATKFNDIVGYFSIPALTGDANNFEVFVKVLDGRSVNGKFWVFFGGLTDFEWTLTLTDTQTQTELRYTKPGYSFAGGADTNAF